MKSHVEELINHLNAQPDADKGFSPKTFYTEGRRFGLTCREILETFLGKDRKIGAGKYPAARGAAGSVNVKPLKKAAKTAVQPVKAVKAAKKAPKIDLNGEPAPDTSIFMYIATPEEIANA